MTDEDDPVFTEKMREVEMLTEAFTGASDPRKRRLLMTAIDRLIDAMEGAKPASDPKAREEVIAVLYKLRAQVRATVGEMPS